MEVNTETKPTIKDELGGQYNWFRQQFLHSVQVGLDEFFSDYFKINLVSLSKNQNVLFPGCDYFVTKIRIDKQHDVFIRCSEDSIKIILDKVLGENKKFSLSNITDLEAKIVSSFNDNLFQKTSSVLLSPPPKSEKRKNFDTIHLTFFISDKSGNKGAKMILSLPEVLLAPEPLRTTGETFEVSHFKSSQVEVGIHIGSTKFSLKDIKSLEKEDLVIFENSNVHTMELLYKGYKRHFKVNPNPGLITSIDNNINNESGGHKMDEHSLPKDLWDNIQVEMGAEFEKVKITLGELKNIEQGSIVNISSVYENKVSLLVENKTIALGELVIVNDHYGVRIEEVFASEKKEDALPEIEGAPHHPPGKIPAPKSAAAEPVEQAIEEGTDESADDEFDYSDFELDDEDI